MKALIFDLDGTLIDSVYPHAPPWQQMLDEVDLQLPAWEIPRLEARHYAFRSYAHLQSSLPGARVIPEDAAPRTAKHPHDCCGAVRNAAKARMRTTARIRPACGAARYARAPA